MLKHSLLIIYRNFLRYKSNSLINLIGLSTGLACTLAIYLWVQDERQVDHFPVQESQPFRVMENWRFAEGINTSIESSGSLADAAAAQLPEVRYAASVAPAAWFGLFTLSNGEQNIKAAGQYAGKDYFNIFPYHLLAGDKDQVLRDKQAIVISDALAKKLFHTTQNVVGKTITFQHQKPFLVTGIFKTLPANFTERFDFVLTWDEMKEAQSWVREWGNNGPHVYLALKNGTDINALNAKLTRLKKGAMDNPDVTLFVKPFSENYLYGRYENGVQTGGRIEYVRLFSLIAVFILLIACINFMNLATAKASRRMKEVGMKKALGASRRTLIFQYLGESLLMALLSLILAIVLLEVFLPQFNQITGKQMALHFDAALITTLLATTVLTGLLAGSYPALYLSGFNPVAVLKGTFRSSLGELWARKGLVVFQFTLSVALLIGVVVVYKQLVFIQTKSTGYDKDHVVYFNVEGATAKAGDAFVSQIKNLPGIRNAALTAHNMVGHNFATGGLDWDGNNSNGLMQFEGIRGGYGLIETLGIRLKEGRSFSPGFGADSTKIILNEAAVTTMNLQNPVGKKIHLWGDEREIVGVTKNFNFESLHEAVKPVFFILAPAQDAKGIMVKIQAGKEKETIAQLEQFYKKYNPDFTLDYKFLDATYQAQYAAEQRVAVLSKYFAGIAILISCLGLLGLAAFTAEKRRKEIGVRKVLGATVLQVVVLLSREFMVLVGIALAIAFPVAIWATSKWLQGFAYKTEIGWWLFALAGLLAILIALITVSTQAIKAATANPVKSLRTE